MIAKVHFHEEAPKERAMHPKKFALWLFLVTVIMVFASLTSYYLVKKSEGNWLEFELPGFFYINTLIILLSSGTMHWAYLSAKSDKLQSLRLAILITTVLGIVFVVGQFVAYDQLIKNGVYLTGPTSNVSGSIVYLLSGLHGLHLVGGVIFLIVVVVAAFQYKIHSKNLVQIEMCATYWHFLDLLWVYLFVFLLLNH